MNNLKWDQTSFETRLEWCRTCGWANRTSQKLAKGSWEQLSPAARNVLVRYHDEYKKIG